MSSRFPDEAPQKAETSENGKKKRKKRKKGKNTAAESTVKSRDFSELREDSFYEDMNEYCADGVCELAVASVLNELREGLFTGTFCAGKWHLFPHYLPSEGDSPEIGKDLISKGLAS